MSPIDEFRQQTRAWLDENCPASQRRPVVKDEQIWAGRDRVFATPDAKLWFERMRDKGWTAPTWPTEYGGGGLSSEEEKVLEKEMARLNCRPALYDLGLWMLGPALLVHGNEAQKQEHLSKIVRGDIRWAWIWATIFWSMAQKFGPLRRTKRTGFSPWCALTPAALSTKALASY